MCAGQDRKGQGQGTLVGKLIRQGLVAAKFLDFPFVAIVEAEGEAAPEPSKRHRPLPTHGVQVDAHGVVALTKIGVMLKIIEGFVQLQNQGSAIALIHDASVLVNDTIMKLQMPEPCRPTPARLAASQSLATLSDGATLSEATSPRSPAAAASTPAGRSHIKDAEDVVALRGREYPLHFGNSSGIPTALREHKLRKRVRKVLLEPVYNVGDLSHVKNHADVLGETFCRIILIDPQTQLPIGFAASKEGPDGIQPIRYALVVQCRAFL